MQDEQGGAVHNRKGICSWIMCDKGIGGIATYPGILPLDFLPAFIEINGAIWKRASWRIAIQHLFPL
jgi:hypothetical protein